MRKKERNKYIDRKIDKEKEREREKEKKRERKRKIVRPVFWCREGHSPTNSLQFHFR